MSSSTSANDLQRRGMLGSVPTQVAPGDLRLADLETFLAVRRYGSASGAARELKVTPSQVSKAVDRLEGALGQALLLRSGRGVRLSEAALRMVPHIEDIV